MFFGFNGYHEFSRVISFMRSYFINFIGLLSFILRMGLSYQIFFYVKKSKSFYFDLPTFVDILGTHGRNGGDSREGNKK